MWQYVVIGTLCYEYYIVEDLIIHLNPHSVIKEEQYILVLLMNSIHPQNQKRLLTLFTQVRRILGYLIRHTGCIWALSKAEWMA